MKKLLTVVILPIIILLLAWLIYSGIRKPIAFNKEKDFRSEFAIQKLKDIRTLQVAYKNKFGKFATAVDSLIDFYKNGKMTIVKQMGSANDSVMMAHTEAVKKANKGITDKGLYELYLKGDHNLVFSLPSDILVKDTLLKREDFNIDSLGVIPFSGGKMIEMKSVVKQVSGVDVPLFEASIPYNDLLRGMDHQLIVNLNAERENISKFPGLKVGSIDSPNNNAGNWE
ncbi:MAG: hypothetical protein IKY05_01570 [Bacteroidales bacterium]|nr:hypothetical protein [Bacteroidales bacterium]MBR4980175.1 hypothetical protein [Bacteroidales bacterium]